MSANNGGNRLDRIEKNMEAASKRMDRAEAVGRRTDKRLDHFVRLGVKWGREMRKERRELKDGIAALIAAQLVTEQKLQFFVSSVGRGSNGKHK